VSKFLNIAFLLILFLAWSCSNLDEPSGLGRKIVEQKSPDSMQSGVYNTTTLAQDPNTYRSVIDSISGLHIYMDFLRNNGARVSQWAIGKWKNEETVLRLSYFVNPPDSSSGLENILYYLSQDPTVNLNSIKADLVWTNLTRYNSFEEIGIEVGMFISYKHGNVNLSDTKNQYGYIAEYSKDSSIIKNDEKFFPLNFIAVNPRNLNSRVPLTIESFLMRGKWKTSWNSDTVTIDSTVVRRYDVDWTNFVDTVGIDSSFLMRYDDALKNWSTDNKATVTSDTNRTQKKHKLWQSDTIISWKHFIPSSFYDSSAWVSGDSINGTLALYSQKIEMGRITRKNKTVKNSAHGYYGGSVYDTLIFDIPKTMLYREERIVKSRKPSAIEKDSVIYTARFENARNAATGKVIPDTLLQSSHRGGSYVIALDSVPLDTFPPVRGLRATGGKGNLGEFMFTYRKPQEFKSFKDTLSIYLRIDKNSTHNDNVLHVSSPLIRISHRKKSGDTTKIYTRDVPFTEKSIIAFSSDTLKNTMPVISGGLQRFAEIDLNLREFLDTTIGEEKFLSVGLADLTLFLDTVNTDFPLQYGDSILVNAIITTEKMAPGKIFALPRVLRTNYGYVKRSFSTNRIYPTAKIPIEGTLVDYLYKNKIYESGAPEKAYLYLWLDDWTMGRIFFNPRSPVYLTYILQTRKDGGL